MEQRLRVPYHYDEIQFAVPYSDDHGGVTRGHKMHVGQVKLLLGEINFLTQYASPDAERGGEFTLCVYAGSAPGIHDAYLAQMFPRTIFVLIDPKPHTIMDVDDYVAAAHTTFFRMSRERKSVARAALVRDGARIECALDGRDGERVNGEIARTQRARAVLARIARDLQAPDREAMQRFYIIEDIFTDAYAREFAADVVANVLARARVLFISDIRTNANDKYPPDADILVNQAMQHTWIRIMQPFASMLKFRTPFWNPGDRSRVAHMSAVERAILDRYRNSTGIDTLAHYEKLEYVYPWTRIALQAYQGEWSTETRVIVERADIDSLHTLRDHEYESKLHAYNMMRYMVRVRTQIPIDSSRAIAHWGNCMDCAYIDHIMRAYLERIGVREISWKTLYGLLYRYFANVRGFHSNHVHEDEPTWYGLLDALLTQCGYARSERGTFLADP